MNREIAIVVCLHGTELSGLKLKEKIQDKFPFFIGNPLAVRKGKRFIYFDLNRIFPGKKEGDYEERRAYKLLPLLKYFKHVIDVHTSACNFPLFGIITKPNKEKIELAKKMGLKKLVIMPEKFAKGKALIDHLNCSISLEVGPHDRKENVKDFIQVIENLGENKNRNDNLFIYEIYEILKGEKETKFFVENFKKVKKGDLIAEGKEKYFAEEDFIPIFAGKANYEGFLCFAAKQVNLKDIKY